MCVLAYKDPLNSRLLLFDSGWALDGLGQEVRTRLERLEFFLKSLFGQGLVVFQVLSVDSVLGDDSSIVDFSGLEHFLTAAFELQLEVLELGLLSLDEVLQQGSDSLVSNTLVSLESIVLLRLDRNYESLELLLKVVSLMISLVLGQLLDLIHDVENLRCHAVDLRHLFL